MVPAGTFGLKVGVMVVGVSVGYLVGASVGENVGVCVGASVRCFVGENAGVCAGAPVGVGVPKKYLTLEPPEVQVWCG